MRLYHEQNLLSSHRVVSVGALKTAQEGSRPMLKRDMVKLRAPLHVCIKFTFNLCGRTLDAYGAAVPIFLTLVFRAKASRNFFQPVANPV